LTEIKTIDWCSDRLKQVVLKWELLSQQQHLLWRDQLLDWDPGIQWAPCKDQFSTKVISVWFGSSKKFTFQGFYIAFQWPCAKSWDVFCKKYRDPFWLCRTGNTQDGWCLWCSICKNLNAVLKKCLGTSYCPTVSSYVYIIYYVLINFWLCYVTKFTWRIQQRWKTFDATVRRGVCPFITLEKNSGLKKFL